MHDIIGFRIIVSPSRTVPGKHPSLTGGSGVRHGPLADDIASVMENGEHVSRGIQSRGDGHMEGTGGLEMDGRDGRDGRGKGRRDSSRMRSKHTRSVFTVKTFPPPYRDADSQILHDVYEVLVNLFEEVPGRFKASQDELRVLSIEL